MSLLTLFLTLTSTNALMDARSDIEVLRSAETAYRAGLQARGDAAVARAAFREAAAEYDQLWMRGRRTPALAASRGQAHLLAGEISRAIQAYLQGLRNDPHDRDLLEGLAYAREQIVFSVSGPVAEEARRREPGLSVRLLATRWFFPACVAVYILGCLFFARGWMKRQPWLRAMGLLLIVLFLGVGGWIFQTRQQIQAEHAFSQAVIAQAGTPLFTGNGPSYPQRFDRLPPGVEVRVLARRGKWLQVELARGAVGWVPAAAVLLVDAE